MKRTIALLFLLIPGMIILGHAIIPHYYDNVSLVHERDKAGEHDEIESCWLSQMYVKINRDEQIFQAVDFDFNFMPCLLSMFSARLVAQTTDLNCLPFRQKPYFLFYHAEFISHSLGLRGPPAV
jgi:hypothetical protein